MELADKTYDTSTFAGLLECVADSLQRPAGNLEKELASLHRHVTNLNEAIGSKLINLDVSPRERDLFARQLWLVNRATQMIETAANTLETAKILGSHVPKPAEELPPAAPISR